MSISKYDHFRNEVISAISSKLTSTDIGIVLAAIDSLSDRYDIVDRETALVTADDTIKQTAALYLCCLRQDGKSNKTVDDYKRILSKFCNALHGRSLSDIRTMDIRKYLLDYQRDKGVRNETIEHLRIVICGFFRWMQDNDYISANPCKNIKQIKCEKRTRTSISGEDVARLRNACKSDRDKVIIEVLSGSGLRVSELANLKLSDINFRDGSMSVIGKGNKQRIAYLTADAMVAIEKYVGNTMQDRYLIIKDNVIGTGVSSRTIERIVTAIYKRANVSTDKRITPHVLRHTFATRLVTHGCPITSVKTLMGHSSISTTMVYTHLDNNAVHNDFKTHSA